MQSQLTKTGQYISVRVGKAIGDYNLIENNDKILVAVSGGKDSLTLLNMLKEAKVNVYKGTIPTHIDGDQVVAEQDDKEVRIPLECLVFAGRRFPVDDLSKSFGEADNIFSIGTRKVPKS